jgi:hypothetical protein
MVLPFSASLATRALMGKVLQRTVADLFVLLQVGDASRDEATFAAWGKMLKIGSQGVGTGSDFFHQAPYIKGYLSVLSLLFQGMVGGQHRTSPFAGELLAVSFVAENS